MSDIRLALLAEIEALERSLREDPRFLKIEALKQAASLYEEGIATRKSPLFAPSRPVTLQQGGSGHMRNVPRATTRRMNPDRERALAEASNYIRGRELPTKTSEILDHLTARGIPVAGTVPLSNLSAMLHHAPEFQSHGRRGWTLAEKDIRDRHEGAQDGLDFSESDEEEDLIG
jgi:hypothetical protein